MSVIACFTLFKYVSQVILGSTLSGHNVKTHTDKIENKRDIEKW